MMRRMVNLLGRVPETARAMAYLAWFLATLVATVSVARGPLPVLFAAVLPTLAAVTVWVCWDRPDEIRRQRQERRAKGLCERCGYDLTGNVSGVCPECGEASRAGC
jgi:hypothetical protein